MCDVQAAAKAFVAILSRRGWRVQGCRGIRPGESEERTSTSVWRISCGHTAEIATPSESAIVSDRPRICVTWATADCRHWSSRGEP